jgi:ubiquinone/menaquinone biosynthesis C-methylase UbiE
LNEVLLQRAEGERSSNGVLMKLNWAERLAVNNPFRVIQQRMEIRWMRRQVGLSPGARVLEVGCGRGAGAILIRETFGLETLLASDLDERMIRRARHYLPPVAQRGISFLVCDVFRLPYPDASLDALFGFGVLHHVPDWEGALAEIARVIRPGGLFFSEELFPSLYQNVLTKRILLHPRENRFRSREFRTAFPRHGLHLRSSLEHRWLGILAMAEKGS